MSGRVLIVDDDPAFCGLVELLLSSAGHVCRAAETPREILSALRQFQPDCVVLDCHFGDQRSGLSLLPCLRRRVPHAPVIMVSADPAWELAADALHGGAFVFWRKTAEHAGLLEAVSSAISEHGLRLTGDCEDCADLESDFMLDFHQNRQRGLSHTSRTLQVAWRRMLDRCDRAVGE